MEETKSSSSCSSSKIDIDKELPKSFSEYDKPFSQKLNVDDFLIIKLVGKGAYGKVFLVRKKDSEDIFAMKILKKKEMMLRDQVLHIKTEKKIMELVDHPFIIKLQYAFHNSRKLYIITNFCPGGELYFHLSRVERFNEASVKFYAAQMILALEHLHSKSIIYRDLKPENVIIDSDGYIKLTDFGLAKDNICGSNKANSFCGTPEYLAPEILERLPYGKEVDWWSLGVIIFEMLTGRPPFYNSNREKLFKSIMNIQIKYPKDISLDARSLFKKLFVRNDRLNVDEIKQHPFFAEIKWDSILNKKIKPPFIPKLRSNYDTKYIDIDFLNEPAVDSYNKGDTVESKDDLFKNFSSDFNFFNQDNGKQKKDLNYTGNTNKVEA